MIVHCCEKDWEAGLEGKSCVAVWSLHHPMDSQVCILKGQLRERQRQTDVATGESSAGVLESYRVS